MGEFEGKKILLIGGSYTHCYAVEAAKEMGLTVYVTDYLSPEKAPAKQMADHAWMYNIYDIDGIVEACERERIDAVLQLSVDRCQKPYQQICERLGKPCYGTAEQFHILTDKTAFKKFCKEHGVGVIPDYDVELFQDEHTAENVEYPVLVKPSICRGSIGQTLCHTYQEVLRAIETAGTESETGEVLIEKYMEGYDDFTMSYLVINGTPHLTRMSDRFFGPAGEGLERVAVGGLIPSKHLKSYLKHMHGRVVKMIQALEVKNGPVFLQGFIRGETVYFYDPAFRFPGTNYESVYSTVHEADVIKPLIEYAVSGKVSDKYKNLTYPTDLGGRCGFILLPPVRPGKICKIEGVRQIQEHPNVMSVVLKHQAGEEILAYHSTQQLVAEVILVCDNVTELEDTVAWIYDTLRVEDEYGENMICGYPEGIAASTDGGKG